MGTRSTVKFYEQGECILSVYQQYDGYLGGVGVQLAKLLQKYQMETSMRQHNMIRKNTIMKYMLHLVVAKMRLKKLVLTIMEEHCLVEQHKNL